MVVPRNGELQAQGGEHNMVVSLPHPTVLVYQKRFKLGAIGDSIGSREQTIPQYPSSKSLVQQLFLRIPVA
jgi:hypothetical protein